MGRPTSITSGKVIQLAAQHKIAVVAHEPTKDTGEKKATFPNMVSREGRTRTRV
ncbi:MAG: glycoside hydrolase family 97 catalytic domain-containing protein [Saprospiraceae bacterium]|nr:glycoside hydrolase family 97 catalytic domain-containing protein [Candidatus Opimibacter skivensis]